MAGIPLVDDNSAYFEEPDEALSCDYLVIGAGSRGMCFVDGLMLLNKTSTIAIVDERESPGGQWHDAPSFFKVSQTSLNYGCPSRPLESKRPRKQGDPPERATKAQVLSYYDSVMEDFVNSGRVRYFPNCTANYDGTEIVSNVCGHWKVNVRNKVVDTTYGVPELPSSPQHKCPFKVHPGATVVTPVGITTSGTAHLAYVVIGGGQVGLDTMLHLLDLGVPMMRLHWVVPREYWYMNREVLYPERFADAYTKFEDMLLESKDLDDMYLQMEMEGMVFRFNRTQFPQVFHGSTLNSAECDKLRRVNNVVRMGHVREVAEDCLVLDDGVYKTARSTLYIDCTSNSIRSAPPPIPIWSEKRITVQLLTEVACAYGELNICLCAAVTGYCEATDANWQANNARCHVSRYPDLIYDWESIHYHHYSLIDSFLQDKKVQWKLLRTRPSNLAMLDGKGLARFSDTRQAKMIKLYSNRKNATLARARAAKAFMDSKPPERGFSPARTPIHFLPDRVSSSTQTDPEPEDDDEDH